MDLQAIGTRVKELRISQSLSRDALAKKAGVHLNTVANVEAGQRDTGVATLNALAEALGVKLADVVGQDETTAKVC